MRTSKLLRGVSIPTFLFCFCAAAGFAQNPPVTPVPLITQVTPPSLSPANLTPGSNSFTLTILGANFAPGELVELSTSGWSPNETAIAFNPTVNATGTQMVANFANVSLPVPGTLKVTVTKRDVTGAVLEASNPYYLPVTPSNPTALLEAPVTSFLQGAPKAMAPADFNGDGVPDLAVISQGPSGTNAVSILIGNSGGPFTAGASYATGNAPSGIVAADFNGDHVVDLAVTNAMDNTVTILLGNGDGTFRQGTTISDPGVYPTQIVAADFNGDGKMDLAVLNLCGTGQNGCYPTAVPLGPGNVAILLGNGDGTFNVAPTLPATGLAPAAMAAADLNADGFIDLIVANSSNNLTLLMGKGDGTFSAAGNTPTTGFYGPPLGIAIGDFNGDGALDVAVTSSGDNAVSILLNQSCAGLPAQQCTLTPTAFGIGLGLGAGPSAIAAADMNADGLLDLVVVNSSAGTISILLGDGRGNFNPLPWPNQSFATGNSPQALALLDVSQDGRLDVVTANQSSSYSVLRQATVLQLQLTTSSSTFVYGYVPTLTVQLTPPPGAPAGPTGTVSLLDGSTQVTSTTLSGYQYQIQFVMPPGYFFGPGTHQLTAIYSGDTNFVSVTSNAVTVTVTQLLTATTISSNVTNAPYGTPVTLTASIQPQAPATATGTVYFTDTTNSTMLGTATLSGNSAQLSLTNLGVGSHAIVAAYSGDNCCVGSSSSSVSVTITQASTTLTLGESPTQAQFGQPVRFTASLPFSGNNPATGTVTFYDGAASLGTVSISNNLATLSVSTLSVGTHAISAQYSGDSNFLGSSGNTTETIIPCSTTVTLTAGINPSVYGSYISMNATIIPAFGSFPAEGVAVGQVAFYDGTTLLGTQTILMSPAGLAVQTLTAGNHTLTAQWLGNTNYAPSTSNAVTQTVTQAASTTSVYTLKNPSAYGQSVTVDVAVDNPYHLTSSGGTITLFDNGTQIATGAMSQGIAFFPLTTLAVGAHSLTASYSGDNDLKASTSTAFTQNVSQATTITSVSLSASSITFGQSATLTATVQAAYTGTPTGTVTFLDGTTTLGTSTIANGSAQFTASGLTPGTHNISAKYSGDVDFTASNSTASQTLTVNQATTTTSISTSSNPSTYGQLVTFSATVQTGSGVGGPTGSVTFLNGSITLGTVPLSSGTAQLAVSSLAGGSQSIVAQYSGDSNFAGSTSTALTETVNPAATSTVISANANPASFGQPVTVTATVQPPAGSTATGTITFLDGNNSLGTATLVNNNAQLTVSTLAVGTHTITAAYSGSANFATSTSAVLTETVNQAPTTTTVTATPNPSVFNQSVVFAITVSAAAGGTPTGTVTLMDGSTTLITATLSGGGTHIYYGGLSPATHSITAVYSGDPNFTGSTSAAQDVVVNQASSTTSLSSSLNPSTYGQAVTLTATVQAPQGIFPFGTVTFMDGSATLGSSSLSNGSAQFTLSGLAAGSHTITAVYPGNTYLTGSTSTGLAQSVIAASSAATVSSSVNPAVFGQTVVLSAAIQPAFGSSATGTVTFLDGAVALGSSPVSGNAAQLSLSSLAIGSHSITVKYSGDNNVAGSTSTALAQTVSQASTTTTVTSGSNPAVFGQSVTFSVRIQSSSSGTPIGTVALMDGASSLGNTALPANGVVQFTISNLAPGAHAISASYSGDMNYGGSTSSVLTETVNPASSTVSIAVSPNPATFGQTVMLTASVTPSVSGDQASGAVTFFDGSTSLGTANLSNNSAQLLVSNLAAGSHSITANYSGDANFGGSTSAALAETVNQVSTTTTLVSSLNPAVAGQSVTFTATVQGGPGNSAAGTVSFLDGSSTLGTVTLASNSAQLTVSTFTVGAHSVTAVYSGSIDFSSSTSAVLTETVNQLATTTTVASNLNPATFGQAVTLTATVQAGSGISVAGTVTFLDGSLGLGTVTLANNSAQLTTSTLAPGAHTLTAVYNSNGNFAGSSSAALTETVNQLNTTTTLTSNTNPALAGQSVTFTATVQAGAGNSPGGTVTFFDGSTTLGSAAVTNNSAQLAISTLAPGSHSITAAYGGSTDFAASTSSALTETVSQSGTTTTLVSNLNPATFGQGVPFIATVQTASGGAATGTVTFYDGATVLGTAGVQNNNSQHNVPQLTFTGFLGGTHTITALYGGDANYIASTSSALTETVNPASSTVTVGASANPASFGKTVVLTATVVPSVSGTLATGTLTFFDGSSSLGAANVSNNAAQISVANFALGAHSITATYGGDRDFAGSTSPALAEAVNPVPTATVVTSSANPVVIKSNLTFTATVSSSSAGTQSGTVNFYLDGSSTAAASVNLSNGMAQYSTNSLSAGSHSVVAVFTSSNPDFSGSTSPAFTQFISDFTVAVSPGSLTVARGTSGTYTLTLTPVGEFSGTVSLSCGGAPGGTTCAIAPTQVTLSGSGSVQATVTITAAQNASKGTHTLTFTGTSGGLNHKITASLTID